MRFIKEKEDNESKTELEAVKKAIAEIAENTLNKLKQQLEKIKLDDNMINAHEIWKLRKKMSPKNRDPPTAMTDKKGNLLKSDEAIQTRALEAYSERLGNNKIEPNLLSLEKDTNELCEIRLKVTKKNKTPPWDMEDLKLAIKQLSTNKSRDPEGLINEIFKEAAAGDDLLIAVLRLMNLIKSKQHYPNLFREVQYNLYIQEKI